MKRLARFALVIALFCSISLALMSQDVEELSLELPSYHSVNVTDGIDMYIEQGSKQSTVLKADSKIMDTFQAEVKDYTLYLTTERSRDQIGVLEAHLTMPQVKSIEASGSSDVFSKGLLQIEELVINARGSSDIDLEIQGAALAATMVGSSDLDLRGQVQDMTCIAQGASDVSAKTFRVQNCILTVTGASDAVIEVGQKLSVEAHGASDVRYLGDPEVVHQVAKGSSSVKKI